LFNFFMMFAKLSFYILSQKEIASLHLVPLAMTKDAFRNSAVRARPFGQTSKTKKPRQFV